MDRNSEKVVYSFQKLQKLSEENPTQVVAEILKNKCEFERLIDTQLSSNDVVLIVKTFANVCQKDAGKMSVPIIGMSSKDHFQKSLQDLMINLTLPTWKEAPAFWEDPEMFFKDVLTLFQALIECVPDCPLQSLHKNLNVCQMVISTLFNMNSELVKQLQHVRDLCTLELEKVNEKKSVDNFRSLNIYPSADEILYQPLFLTKNLLDLRYMGPNHYLGVQFLSTKGNLTGFLRKVFNSKTSIVKDRIVVNFLSPIWIRKKFGVLVKFKESTQNKKCMFGSMLCFVRNNFQSLFFGKVIDQTEELKQNGQFVVEFEPGQVDYLLGQDYDIIDCCVCHDKYFYAMRALQNMRGDQFPMKKYIVDANPHIDRALNSTHDENLNNLSQLNSTQLSAFREAITKQLTVIQGYPGTGKTFLGIKIVNTLTQRKIYDSPILIISNSNSALDKFLEGFQNTKLNVLRIGSKSKYKHQEKFSFKENLKMVKISDHFRDLHEQIRRHNYSSEVLRSIYSNSAIIHFRKFSSIEKDYSESWFAQCSSDDDIIEWLLETQVIDDVEENGETEDDDLELTNEYDFDDDLDFDITIRTKSILTNVSEIKSLVEKIKLEEAASVRKNVIYEKKTELQTKRCRLERHLKNMQTKFKKFKNVEVKEKPSTCNLRDPLSMPEDDRWLLYLYWVKLYKQSLIDKLSKSKKDYQTLQNEYNKLKSNLYLSVMKKMHVVGMTSTTAANFQTVINHLKCPIVIVEDADKIIESQVVTSLTSDCQHLILIGNNQQPKPSSSCKLGISLFERMVRNNISCHLLEEQYRMRPEIANLIIPIMYPKMVNHPSVSNFKPVLGILLNCYFIDHKFEEKRNDPGIVNYHEVKFIIRLARYLIQNGYKPEDLTILSADKRQTFALWKEQKKCWNFLEGVTIASFNEYEGNESKIILLSLVRNNSERKLGNLNNENIVIQALSRAKEGLYMMGNMELCKSSNFWQKIIHVLLTKNSLGTSLTLRCQNHHRETKVTLPEDFEKVPEGGCNLKCDAKLRCGHICTMSCHVTDREHKNFQCKTKCSKILCNNNHECPNLCYEQCKPCSTPVTKTLRCKHKQRVPCHADVINIKCIVPVETTLNCGHLEKKLCYIPTTTLKCNLPCNRKLKCNHICPKTCHFDIDPEHFNYKCEEDCNKMAIDCSTKTHKCPKKCYEPCVPCEKLVQKRRACKHSIELPCNVTKVNSTCQEKCEKVHPCGHQCQKKCGEGCGKCMSIETKVVDSCNHSIKIACYITPTRSDCFEQCPLILDCGHKCPKKCNEECGGCTEEITKELSECKHQVTVKCGKALTRKLCFQKCPLQLACGHECENKCNEPCTTSCKVLVKPTKPSECGHDFKIECYKKESVNTSSKLLELCSYPCNKFLSCKHKCSGSCRECAQGRFHKRCLEKHEVVLICGHTNNKSCSEPCHQCTEKCLLVCKHGECKMKCGEPCRVCKEECPRRCAHVACKALCGEVCTVAPCTEPCPKILPCEHPCIGFCGDPCPKLCKECHREKFTSKNFGKHFKNARFVELDECKHVVESVTMDLHLKENDEEVAPKCCPRCNITLTSTQRYKDHIKKSLRDLCKAVAKFKGTDDVFTKMQAELLHRITILRKEEHIGKVTRFVATLQKLEDVIINSKFTNRLLLIDCMKKIKIIDNIIDGLKKAIPNTEILDNQLNFLLTMLERSEVHLTSQEQRDFKKEIQRWSLLVQISLIENSNLYKLNGVAEFSKKLKICKDELFALKALSHSVEMTKLVSLLMEKFVIVEDEQWQDASIEKNY